MPAHIAFEMDGNRRYARALSQPPLAGHVAGFHALHAVLGACMRLHIRCVTVFAFSIENFARPPDEVNALMRLAEEKLRELGARGAVLEKYGVRVNVLGRRELLPAGVRAAVEWVEGVTRGNERAVFNLCMPYTSQDEITSAVQAAVREGVRAHEERLTTTTPSPPSPSTSSTTSSPNTPTPTPTPTADVDINAHLSTTLAGSPPLDILIRTSGVKRLSGFMQWQASSHTQIHLLDTYWPSFGLAQLVPVLLAYQRGVWGW
ncbi:Decaprenyl diphosphate synthase-like protein [Hygrophoropsis aurantiaca]|uniref:Decaprenyl diphosphate synthase-like protein n=1 Tax=Hygrophoropsis aurantiaca TaxID=72124 RepID=A0ACB7ZVA3_9AGAM|nr:Decaprenyl diphosphate synthase-like protein [Hygrophoropsis aurantiaca]